MLAFATMHPEWALRASRVAQTVFATETPMVALSRRRMVTAKPQAFLVAVRRQALLVNWPLRFWGSGSQCAALVRGLKTAATTLQLLIQMWFPQQSPNASPAMPILFSKYLTLPKTTKTTQLSVSVVLLLSKRLSGSWPTGEGGGGLTQGNPGLSSEFRVPMSPTCLWLPSELSPSKLPSPPLPGHFRVGYLGACINQDRRPELRIEREVGALWLLVELRRN
mmetsp:Transcript_25445/g.57133  ORF Transcript_25445/g.57133 Transcript_25445/m.57133 type:complete len:222 (-) Transcript_25445:8-673(-)